MTEYMQILQSKEELAPGLIEKTFAIWDIDKDCTLFFIFISFDRWIGIVYRCSDSF